jgi:hypothetical protein
MIRITNSPKRLEEESWKVLYGWEREGKPNIEMRTPLWEWVECENFARWHLEYRNSFLGRAFALVVHVDDYQAESEPSGSSVPADACP